jgi:acetyl esterase/lipase
MKMLFQSLLLAGLLFSGACTKEDTTVDNTDDTTTTVASTQKDVAYATVSSAQKMDIYMPEGAGPFPVVILIHGGAFLGGSKSDEASNAAVLNANGYVAVSINYRLSGEAKFPAQIEDCKTSVRFLRANAAKYKINPEKIGSWGASAGGNLSALLGTSGNVAELEGASLGNETYSSAILASVDWFGPINFLTMDAEAAVLGFSINTNSSSSPESKLMGAAVQTIPDAVAKANPASYISSDDAAFFIQAGSVDRNIPYTQSRNFYQALLPVKGSDVSFELLEGAGHGGSQFSASTNLAKVISFFDKYLK